jgi:hypothetical protein
MAHLDDDLDRHAGVIRRLRAMGSQSVDPVVAARHAALMNSVSREAVAPRRRLRPVVVGGLVAGTLFGSMGLAGALTGSVPPPARAVLQTVGLMDDADDGDDKPRKVEPAAPKVETPKAPPVEVSGPEGQVAPGEQGVERVPCENFTGTHGQWVQARPDDPATEVNERSQAAHDDCGMPEPSTTPGPPEPAQNPGVGTPGGPPGGGGPPTESGSDDSGRPPDPGKPPGVGTDAEPDGADGPPSAPGNRPAGAGKDVAGP